MGTAPRFFLNLFGFGLDACLRSGHPHLPRKPHRQKAPLPQAGLSLLTVAVRRSASGTPRAENPALAPRHRGRHREGNAYAKRYRTEHGILPPCQRLVPDLESGPPSTCRQSSARAARDRIGQGYTSRRHRFWAQAAAAADEAIRWGRPKEHAAKGCMVVASGSRSCTRRGFFRAEGTLAQPARRALCADQKNPNLGRSLN